MVGTLWAVLECDYEDSSNGVEAAARVFVAGSLDTLRAEARVSGPIVRDRVMGSAAIMRGVSEGFVRDLDHPDHPLGGEDVTAARGTARRSTAGATCSFRGCDRPGSDTAHLCEGARGQARVPGRQSADLREVRTSTLAEGHNLQYGGAARLTMRLTKETTLTSLTAYRKLDYNVINDA